MASPVCWAAFEPKDRLVVIACAGWFPSFRMWIRLGVRLFRCLNTHWIDFRHDNRCFRGKFCLFSRNCSSLPTVGLLLAHDCSRKGVAVTSSLVWGAGARDSLSIAADQDHTILRDICPICSVLAEHPGYSDKNATAALLFSRPSTSPVHSFFFSSRNVTC